MPRKCSLCYHDQRDAIEKAIREHVSIRDIAGQFKIGRSAVSRHAAHILKAAALDPESPIVILPKAGSPKTFLLDMEGLKEKAEHWLDLAEKAENSAAAVTWHRALRETLELFFKVGVEQMRAREGANGGPRHDDEWFDRYTKTAEAQRQFPGLHAAFWKFCEREVLAAAGAGGAGDEDTGFQEATN
jgi:hypothetical protein